MGLADGVALLVDSPKTGGSSTGDFNGDGEGDFGKAVGLGDGDLRGVGVGLGLGDGVGVGSGWLIVIVETLDDQLTEDKFPPLVV